MNYIDDFLQSSGLAKNTQRDKKRLLMAAFNYFNNNFQISDFFLLQPSHFEQFFRYVDSLDITKKSKQRYMLALRNYADYRCGKLIIENKKLPFDYSYLLSSRFFKFSRNEKPTLQHFLNLEELRHVLKWARFTQSAQFYFAVAIQLTTGMRTGSNRLEQGLISLTPSNFDLRERLITVYSKGKINYYIINRQLLPSLKFFLEFLEDEERLFNFSEQKYNLKLKKYANYLHGHIFRHSLNIAWEDAGVPEPIRAILLNQVPEGTNSRYYLRRFSDPRERRKRYDEVDVFRDFDF